MKVLLCEDDTDIAELIEILVCELEYEFKVCTNIHKLVETMEEYKPDLLILDYWLNGVKSDKFLGRIRAKQEISAIPVLLISAVDNLSSIAGDLNVIDFVRKPFDINEFQSKVKNMVTNYDKADSNN